MKRIIFSVILLFCLVTPVRASEKQEEVKVYLFWSNSCHNCHNLMKSFSKVYNKYKSDFEIVTIRTDNNEDNRILSNKVAQLVGEEPGYVPLVVIGDTYHVLGWNQNLLETIIKEAKNARGNYTDIVADLIESESLKSEQKSFEEALEDAGIKNRDVQIISVVALLSSIVLLGTSIILKRKNLFVK